MMTNLTKMVTWKLLITHLIPEVDDKMITIGWIGE